MHKQEIESLRAAVSTLRGRMEVVLAVIDADTSIDAGQIDDMCALYIEVSELEQELRDLVKLAWTTTDRFKNHRIIEKLDTMGVDKVAVPSLKRSFYPRTRYSASMLNREEGMGWLRKNGGGELITETVNHQTLTAFIKAMVTEDGKEPPADVFRFSSHRYIGSSAYSPK